LRLRTRAPVMQTIEWIFQAQRRSQIALQDELAVTRQGAEIGRAHGLALFQGTSCPAARGYMGEHRIALGARQTATLTGTHCASPVFCPAYSTIRDSDASASSLAFSRWRCAKACATGAGASP